MHAAVYTSSHARRLQPLTFFRKEKMNQHTTYLYEEVSLYMRDEFTWVLDSQWFASVSAPGLCTIDAKQSQLTTLHSLDGGFARGVFIGGNTVIPAHSVAQAVGWRMLAPVTLESRPPSVLLEGWLSNDLKVVRILKGNTHQTEDHVQCQI